MRAKHNIVNRWMEWIDMVIVTNIIAEKSKHDKWVR